jgi:hypothetical protein
LTDGFDVGYLEPHDEDATAGQRDLFTGRVGVELVRELEPVARKAGVEGECHPVERAFARVTRVVTHTDGHECGNRWDVLTVPDRAGTRRVVGPVPPVGQPGRQDPARRACGWRRRRLCGWR